ncbi:MAG: methionine synthase [Dehalococcoidia bacterium]|nr:methionine synthase [Dehalococcoidia bacterium]
MPARLEVGCLPTAIGSMPHTDPDEACAIVMKYLPDIPVWPQLPGRSPMENMVIQNSEGFPGVVIEGDRIRVEPPADFEGRLEQIHVDSEQDNADEYGISAAYAAGLHALLSAARGSRMVKGQVTGPITWGLTVTRPDGLGILYDDMLADTAARFLRLKASWQESTLRQLSRNTIVFVDEPCLVSLGSVFTPIPEQKVPALLGEVFSGIKGIKGLHCCGNTDWPVLLDTAVDILSFDAYSFASSLSSHSGKVKCFLERGGSIAWGIVPSDEEALAKESLPSLRDRLEEGMAALSREGVSFRQIVAQGLLTPSCGLAGLSLEAAEQALALTADLSQCMRSRYAA